MPVRKARSRRRQLVPPSQQRVPIAHRLPVNHIIQRALRMQANSPKYINNVGEAIVLAILHHFRKDEEDGIPEHELVDAYKLVIRTMYPALNP